jgi:hypothetical protein
VYFVVGRVFAQPTGNARAWRLAAWAVSAVVYLAHIGYERLKLRSSPSVAALHVALAVAIGAIGLATAVLIRSLSTQSAFRMRWVLALVGFPAITAVPAFLVALLNASLLRRAPTSADDK